jgi:hypothetical protein
MNMTDTETDISQWWRLNHSVSVVDASLLALGLEPQRFARNVERLAEDSQPIGYRALKTAILTALSRAELPGHLIDSDGVVSFDFPFDVSACDPAKSSVEFTPLLAWLEAKGFSTNSAFSEDASAQTLRDKSHPRYAPKLAAAVAAWEAFDESSSGAGTAKQKLTIWLRLHACEYGLVDEDGEPRDSVIEEIATIANWATRGGAPKRGECESGG